MLTKIRKHGIKRFILIIGMLSFALGIRISLAADINVHSTLNFDWWESATQAHGTQIYSPIRIESHYNRLTLGLLTGYAYTMAAPNGGNDGSLADTLDTKLNLSYHIPDTLPADILFCLDLNLPTGRTGLAEGHPLLATDQDLLSIHSLGEGFNINPILIVAKEWERWGAGMGCGYLWRGEYDYSTKIRDYDPDDIYTMLTKIEYKATSHWRVRLLSDYASYDKDRAPYGSYQKENLFLLGSALQYQRAQWDAEIALQRILKSNQSNQWITSISCRYSLNDQMTIQSFLEFFFLEDNEKEKSSLGISCARLLNEHLEAGVHIKGFVLDDNQDYYRGFSLGTHVARRF